MAQARALQSVQDLLVAGLAQPEQAQALEAVAQEFRIRVTPEMQRTEPGLARQFLPDVAELTIRPEELHDPIGDTAHSPTRGLTHRYPDRVILAVTHACEVYCRFCFRREVVGEAAALPEADLEAAFAYIAAASGDLGGDPDRRRPAEPVAAPHSRRIVARLSAIPHVEILRFHTRVPVVAPEKITAEMVAALQGRAQQLCRAAQQPPRRDHPCRPQPPWRGLPMRGCRCCRKACCCAASTTMPAVLEALMPRRCCATA